MGPLGVGHRGALILAGAIALSLTAGCYRSHGVGEGTFDVPTSAVTMACPGGAGGGASRDCGWRIDTTRTCAPGRAIRIGCGCDGLGSCAGDPMLRACRGPADCRSGVALASVDDRCGLCPAIDFTCPPEGLYTVLTAPFSAGGSYMCTIAVRD